MAFIFPTGEETTQLLALIESTSDESERQRAIDQLAERGHTDACRVLIETFERSMWRSTKISIVRALGRMDQQRGIEFLLRLASDEQDLGMATEAVLSLGNTNSPAAGEFLLTLMEGRLHPLRREAVLALSNMRYFPCDRELAVALENSPDDLSPGFLQYLVLSAGRRGQVSAWPKIRSLLNPEAKDSGAVFNAALLAAGQIGGEDALAHLRSLNLTYRFFADELRLASIERIQRRLNSKVEEIILELLACPDDAQLWERLFQLRLFPKDAAWKAFELLGDEGSATLQCLVRATLFDASRVDADLAFLISRSEALDPNAAAVLIYLHVGTGNAKFYENLYQKLPRKFALRWLERVRDPGAVERLFSWLEEGTGPEQSAVINGIVAQAQMAGLRSAVSEDCGRRLFVLAEEGEDGPLQHRMIRALGQIDYGGKRVLAALERLLKKGFASTASIYKTLAALKTTEAAAIVIRRMRKGDLSDAELDQALAALASMGALVEDCPLPSPGSFENRERRRSLLLILTANRIHGYEDVIVQALKQGDFQDKMMALAAAKLNQRPKLWNAVFEFLNSPNACLRGRALDTLCAGDEPQQMRLLKQLLPHAKNRDTALKLFQTLVPHSGFDYQNIVALLDRWMAEREGVFADQEILEAAVQLRDRLVIATRPPAPVNEPRGDRTVLLLDEALTRQIPGFAHYGELVRSTLRNAELTYQHPELFGERVDKSSAVVQYVKCIDLLLQEHVGKQLFLDQSGQFVIALQSRLVQLQLQEEYLPMQRVLRDLQCESHFGPDTFPLSKLGLFAKAILSGKIFHDQLKTFDGLRAWSLAILLFGRRFRFRSTELPPLFQVRVDDNGVVCALAAQLNILQNERNDAAHRGTVVRAAELSELRQRSLTVLGSIDRIFAVG